MKKNYFKYLTIALFAWTLSLNISAQSTFNVDTVVGSIGKLSCVVHLPKIKEGQKCPFVVIMHGFTGNKNENMLKQISEGLQQRGIGSVRFDFNAHGNSEGQFRNMTIKNEIEDAMKIIKVVKNYKCIDPQRIGLLGHSQGGVVASMTAGLLGDNNIKAVVLLAPAANIGEDTKHGKMLGTRFDPNNLPETISVWNHTVGKQYLEYAMSCDMYGTAQKFQGPVLIIHGSNDKAVPCKYGVKYAEVYKNAKLVKLPDDDHGLSKHRPQTLNYIYTFFVNCL